VNAIAIRVMGTILALAFYVFLLVPVVLQVLNTADSFLLFCGIGGMLGTTFLLVNGLYSIWRIW
jgi:hypothetical protein